MTTRGFSECRALQVMRMSASALRYQLWPDRNQLFLIEPVVSNQNALIESFNGRFRDECLNEHRFTSLPHAKVVIQPLH